MKTSSSGVGIYGIEDDHLSQFVFGVWVAEENLEIDWRKMTNYWCLCLVAATIAAANGYTLTMDKADIKIASNPFFENWSASIASGKDKITLKTPIKKDLPMEMKVKVEMKMGDDDLPDQIMTVCQAFNDDNLKEVFELGKPAATFPKECPVRAGSDFVIENYPFPSEKIPDGTPEGPMKIKVSIFEDGQDPCVIMELEGNIAE